MDTKFRKLISRLSIKEKKLEKMPYPQIISVGPLVLPADSSELSDVNAHLTNSNGNEQSSTNILTTVRFPCPTLLRKSKSMSERPGSYDEVKLKKTLGLNFGNDMSNQQSPPSQRQSIGSSTSDENNNAADERSGGQVRSGSDFDGDYMNLQEVEQERRRLVAAQRVRAKYAESWIDDQAVDTTGILGNNKEKTKLYWETLMRQESMESERHIRAQRTTSSSTTTTTSPIILKINAEIQELQRREKELMSRGSGTTKGSTSHNLLTSTPSQQEEEDDVFSSNSSSLDEFEPSESPRLESGFYSNLGEDETPNLTLTLPPEVTKGPPEVLIQSPVKEKVDLTLQPQRSAKTTNGLLMEVVADSEKIGSPQIFKFQKETPIEREIRLASQRDEEHRRRSLTSLTEPVTPKPNGVVSEVKKSTEPSSSSSVKTTTEVEDKRFPIGTGSVVRNIQYTLATERLRKEMQEAQRREVELQKVQRTVSMSTLGPYEPELEKKTEAPVLKASPVTNGHLEVKLDEKQVKPNGLDFDLSPLSPTLSDSGTSPLRSPFSKSGSISSFNSIQRYLLKSSVQLRIANNFQLPPPPVEKPIEKVEPVKVVEEVEPEPPRRKLVPATHKIQNELREMKEREKELALVRTRNFKSTPNLLVDLTLADEKVEVTSPPPPLQSYNSIEVTPPKERKRSNLINQWEMIIQSGN